MKKISPQQQKTIPLKLIENTYPPYEVFRKILKNGVTQVDFVDAGVLNYIFRATCADEQVFYLKQALEKPRRKDIIGQDFDDLSPLRIEYEATILQKLSKFFPSKDAISFPQVALYDKENNILVTRDLRPVGFLQSDLQQGIVDLEIAGHLGTYLGLQHRLSFSKKNILRGNREEDHQNWLFWLNMRTRGVIPKSSLNKKVAEEINNLYTAAKNNHTYDVIINMDCCPKNVLCLPYNRVGIVDLELASGIGDPAYDPGFLIGHYFIFAANDKIINKDFLYATEKILETYLSQAKSLPVVESDDFQKRLIKYAASTMIYRVAGSSPAPFVNKKAAPKIMNIACSLLTEEFPSFENALNKFNQDE